MARIVHTTESIIHQVNTFGGSGDEERGSWCTPKWIAELLGEFFLDPCSNPRSHVKAKRKLMLENGDNGLHNADDWTTGQYHAGLESCSFTAKTDDDVFVNPPYERGSVIKWVRHYRHTNFTFLLKWDPSTAWFTELIGHCHYVWFPYNRRIAFEPPPGVKASSNPFPHALYLRNPPRERFERLKSAGIMLTLDDENLRLLSAA